MNSQRLLAGNKVRVISSGPFRGRKGTIMQQNDLQLNDRLRICLLAVVSRYPDCVVEIDPTLPTHPYPWEEDCSPKRALQLLQIHEPDLLEASARLMIDEDRPASAISLIDQFGERPALHLYCGDCLRTKQRKHGLHECRLVLVREEVCT
jgi:hypothetical protein